MARPVRTETQTKVRESTDVSYRVSVGLISLSLSLISLSLGVALFLSPLPNAFLVPLDVRTSSVPSSATAVTLSWTAPGDDGDVGQASYYDIRYSTTPMSSSSFATATPAAGVPLPQPAGSTESYTVTGLTPDTTYYFGLKTVDEANNASAISNIATKTTAPEAAACVPSYTCGAWSTCVNNVQTRTCSVTNNCPAGLDAPIASQTCTSTITPPDPAPSGGSTPRFLKPTIVAATAPGTTTKIRVINPTTRKVEKEFLPFGTKNKTGAHVTIGDLNGDHVADIVVGSGRDAAPLVKVYTRSGQLVTQFNPYPTTRTSGVSVAVADTDGDGKEELITIPAKSTSQVRIFSYNATTKKFTNVAQGFTHGTGDRSGFTIAAGDLDLDGKADFVVASRGNTGTVKVYRRNGKALKAVSSFRPYNRSFTTGITVAIGDTNGDGRGDVITSAGPSYYSNVRVSDIRGRKIGEFLPASTAYKGGVTLTSFDIDQDGRDDVITGTYQQGDPGLRVFRYDGVSRRFRQAQSYYVYPRTMKSGLRISGA